MLGSWKWHIIVILVDIFDTKDDSILHISSQEQSMSSKYDCVLGALLFMLGSWKFAYSSIMTYKGYLRYPIWYQIWPNPPILQSGTINILQVWLCSWCTFIHARELNISIQLNNDILVIHDVEFDTKYNKILQNSSQKHLASSKYDFDDGGSWSSSKHARVLKLGTKVTDHLSGWSMTSEMTPSSNTPVRNV